MDIPIWYNGDRPVQFITTLDSMPPALDEVARQRIKAWLAGSGMSQIELARRLGKTQAWVSRYLRGEFNTDMETLQQMARIFGHTFFALLDVPSDALEAELVGHYRALPADMRRAVLTLLAGWTRRLRKPGRLPE
jgi:transcriptional regulator with XRE-family HTH domain